MASGQDLRITDVPFSNLPATTATVFINDNGKLRQTDLTTVAKNSELHTLIVDAHQTALDDIHATHGMYTEEWERIHDHTLDAFQRASDQHIQTLDDKLNTSSDELSQLIEAGHEKLQDDIKVVDELCAYAATVRETTFEKNAQLTPTVPGNVIISSVKGDSYQKQLSGKQMFDKSTATDGVAIGTGGSTYTDSTMTASDYIAVVAGETYATTNIIWLNVYDAEKVNVTQIAQKTVNTFTVPDNGAYVILSLATTKKDTAQLEKGSTATDYEEFCGGTASPNPDYPQEIESVDTVTIKVQNKNYFDVFFNLNSKGNNSSATNTYSGGVLKITTNASESSGIYCFPISANRNKLAGKTVTLSADITISNGSKVLFRIGDGTNKTTLTANVKTRVSFTYKYSDTTNTPIIIYSGELVAKTITVENIQLEFNEVATDYTPHEEHEITIPLSEPLRKNDAICVIDGVYGVLRRRNRYAVSSSVGGYNEASDWYYVAIANIDTNLDVSKPVKSNYFTWVNNASYVTNNENLMSINSSGTHMVFNVESCTSGAEYRAWLDEHDVYVEYELATPVFEPFEDQTPFYELMAYDEVTNISIVCGDNLNPSATVMYPSTESGVLLTSAYADSKMLNQKLDEEVTLRAQQVAGIDERLANEAYLRNEIGVACVANTTALNGYKLFACSQDVFDNMAEYDTNTLYIITE